MRASRVLPWVAVLVMALAIVPAASAAGPSGSWVTGITCQNLSATQSATINVDFYQENNSTSVLSYADPNPILPGTSRNYYTPNTPPGLPSLFLGSAIVSSDQELACNVNTQTNGTGTAAAPYRIGTSSGVSADSAAPKLYVPQVEKLLGGAWSSYIAVQNTTAAGVPVTVSYKDRYGAAIAAATEHFTIPAQSSKVFYQADNANLASGFLGAAIVSADDNTSKLAAVVALYNSGADSSTSQLLSYNSFGSAAQSYYVPRVVRNYYGYNGGITIQNVGGSPTTVTIDFYFPGGRHYQYLSPSISAGAALPLYTPNIVELAPVDAIAEASRTGNATITAAAGGSIVAIVNEDNRGGAGVPAERVGQGASYNAIPVSSATPVLFFPQVPRRAGGIFSGGFVIANTTAALGHCTISYAGVSAATETSIDLPANGKIDRYAPSVANLTDGFNSSVSVNCGTTPVIGISNLAAAPGTGKLGDSFAETTGLNR
jgi:hypothetical protein